MMGIYLQSNRPFVLFIGSIILIMLVQKYYCTVFLSNLALH